MVDVMSMVLPAGISFLQTGVQEVNGFFDGQSTPLKTEIEHKNECLRKFDTIISLFNFRVIFRFQPLYSFCGVAGVMESLSTLSF